MKKPTSHFYLSPSRIARAFYHECDRYLRFHATPKDRRKAEQLPAKGFDRSPVTEAILDQGYDWETEVVQKKLKGRVKVAKGGGPVYERAFGVAETLAGLKGLNVGEALYQGTIEPPVTFARRYGLDPAVCHFPECRPDLVVRINENGKDLLRVIDIKASDGLKSGHRIQATLYALMLRELCAGTPGIPEIDLKCAGIWLHGQPEPEWFDMDLSLTVTEEFLRDRLPKILFGNALDVPWHLFFRCEWCEFFKACNEEAIRTSSVSLVPGLTVGGRKFLRSGPWAGAGKGVDTLDEFSRLLARKDIGKTFDACGSLRGQQETLAKKVESLKSQKIVPFGSSSVAMPVNESVRIVLTLQAEPLTGKIYAAGFQRFKGKEVYPQTFRRQVFVAPTEGTVEGIRADFIKALHAEMEILHTYNEKQTEWKDKKSLQAYVYDNYENELFQQLLREALDVPELAPLALQMLFHFQDTSLSSEDEHPGDIVPFPVIVVTGVLRSLLALPIPFSYRLPEVHSVLNAGKGKFSLKGDDDLFWSPLSNAMKSDSIAMAWSGRKPEAVGWVEKQINARLNAADQVIDAIKETVGAGLFAWPPKFAFPTRKDFRHPELSRLSYIALYESFMSALATREARTAPWAKRVVDNVSVRLRSEGGEWWKVEGQVEAEALETDFKSYLLVLDGDAGEKAQMSYDDFRYRTRMYPPSGGTISLASVPEEEVDPRTGFIRRVRLSIDGKAVSDRKGTVAVLHNRFTDFTTKYTLDQIGELDRSDGGDFLRLVREPARFGAMVPKKEPWVVKAEEAAKAASFTKSQGEAFSHILGHRLTLVWGPPGTGKTHFLANAVLAMAKAHKATKKPFRVGVTAFTHAAVENLLSAIKRDSKKFGIDKDLNPHKLKYVTSPVGHGLSEMPEGDVSILSNHELVVVGGTVYSFRKATRNQIPHVDLLIVDEASQMKFGELVLGMMPFKGEGRLVMAGDDLQLPPIVKGAYPEPEDGLPGLHESVFAWTRQRGGASCTHKLAENWRMNSTLSQFPAQTLYGSDYTPATEAIAKQKIVLVPADRKKNSPQADWRDHLLDPAFPMVLAVLEDVQATTENQLEAEMVADLCAELRNRLIVDGKTPRPATEEGDRRFWRRDLFVVSPHHAQIRAIRRELQGALKKREWLSSPFVDTVDKMQGQEAEAVIVSYGVSDIEAALSEADFIYSLNRMNVSVSRAKAKCIVFLPRPLLTPAFEVFDNKKASDGYRHMRALLDFCRAGDSEKNFNLSFFPTGKGKAITVYRR